MKKMQKLFQVINSGKYKYTKFNQFLNYFTHNKNEIKRSPPKKTVKAKGTIWNWNMKDNVMAKDIVITVYFWREFPLSSMKNSKSLSVCEFIFLNLLQVFIFCRGIY